MGTLTMFELILEILLSQVVNICNEIHKSQGSALQAKKAKHSAFSLLTLGKAKPQYLPATSSIS